MQPQQPPAPAQQLTMMITGFWISSAIYVAAKLRIADLLKDGPQTVERLAEQSESNGPSLRRLLRALASVGVFAEEREGVFRLTPMAELLRSDVPGSQWALSIMFGEEMYQAYGNLLGTVRTGDTAFDTVVGRPLFAFMQQHPEKAAIFDRAMVGIHGPETAAMLDAYDLSNVKTLADIGGGNGSVLIETLRRYPNVRGVLYDLPAVVERAKWELAAAGVGERVQAIGGDFFESVPVGADLYVLRHIIHDWDDAKSIQILRNIRGAIGTRGRLILVENVIPPGNDPCPGKLLDLTMLAITGGLERTRPEYERLLERAGFRLTRIVPTTADVSVIEAVPA